MVAESGAAFSVPRQQPTHRDEAVSPITLRPDDAHVAHLAIDQGFPRAVARWQTFAPTMETIALNPEQQLLECFIDDESQARQQGRNGRFYPSHHHRIMPAVSKAPRWLSRDQRVRLYLLLLSLDRIPMVKRAGEFELLLEAYGELVANVPGWTIPPSLHRIKGLFLFGYNADGALAGRAGVELAAFLDHLKFWRYVESFLSMPGILGRRARFVELSANASLAARVMATIQRIQPVQDLPRPTCLWFWALMLLALQLPASARAAIEWLLHAECGAHRRELLGFLRRYLAASGQTDLIARFGLDQHAASPQ